MNKKILFGFVLTLAAIFIGVSKISASGAIEINQELLDSIKEGASNSKISYEGNKFVLQAGSYKLTSNIDLPTNNFITTDGDVALNLGTYSISGNVPYASKGIIDVTQGKVSIDGTGSISNGGTIGFSLQQSGGTISLLGNVTYVNQIYVKENSTITINGGTFNGIRVDNSNVTINGGTFKNCTASTFPMTFNSSTVTINGGTANIDDVDAVMEISRGDVKITGGTFTSTKEHSIAVRAEICNLQISGGTFTGDSAGVFLNPTTTETIELSGGTYKGTSATSGAIFSGIYFDEILATGYKFSSQSTTTDEFYSVKEVHVIPITYTVTFKDGDKTLSTQTVAYKAKVTKPVEPTKTGYLFKNWSNVDGKTLDSEITSDTAFNAVWITKFDVKTGENPTFYLESDKDVTIVVDVPFNEFKDFIIWDDNKPIHMSDLKEGTDYIVEEGSTKLTLKNSFLKKLSSKKYTVEINFINNTTYGSGTAKTVLTVKNGSEPISNIINEITSNPKTGDNIVFYISMLGLSIVSLIFAGLYIKKAI